MNQNFLQHLLWSSWSKETAYKWVWDSWNYNNRATGQCAITSILVQEILWWYIKKADVENYKFSHYWNYIDWEDVDFTISQFSKNTPSYINIKLVDKDRILLNEETKKQYEILRKKVYENMDIYKNIEKNIQQLCQCNENIHQLWSSIHFWKNCNLLFIWEAPAKDGWRTTWKAWINEKWNIIPSGKILQQLLEYLNINLMDITFTEAVKCFPKDRKELLSMGKLWQKILYEQIDFLSPHIIITLWDFPTKALLWNTYKKFTDVVWKEFFIEIKNQKYIIIPTYHPSPISPQSLKGNIDIYKKINKLLNT